MPMPLPNTAWPPAPLTVIRAAMDQWDAWYVGNPDGLDAAYSRTNGARPRPGQLAGGIVGAVSRLFWGKPRHDLTSGPTRKLHLPVASDICQASADLLFADPPVFTVDDETTQERLDELVDDGLLQTLAEAAELSAALGGGFVRVTWDTKVMPDRPFLSAVDADGAWPVFRWGRLAEVTFWSVVEERGQVVVRHLEHHRLNEAGDGVVEHALFEGNDTTLGRRVELSESSATSGLDVDTDSVVSTETPGLAVVYVPNLRPQRRWRKDPVGKNLGRSDLDGVEGLMDALDEVYSSWMRDIDLGKGRIIASESVLDDLGPGHGSAFDTDRSVFTPIRTLAARSDGSALPIEAVQFQIRVEEHQSTAQQLLSDILRTAGYSAQTFGEMAQDSSITATEVHARQSRSLMTRDRKIRSWKPALQEILEKLLAVDAALFSGGGAPVRPDVEFPPSVQESQLALAQTASALRVARAASTETLVRMVNPEWDDPAVLEEVGRIMAEDTTGAMADPTTTLPEGAVTDDQLTKEDADALGVLVRAGVDPADAARRVGFPGLVFTGAIPTSLRPKQDDAATLEDA